MPPVFRKLQINKSLPEEAKIKVGYSNQGTSINGLPFDCFYLIFCRFDLRTQILTLRTVCHIWHDHITQICATKSHLTLRPYFKPLAYYHISKNWFTPRDLQRYVTNREAYCNDLEFRLPKIDKLTTNSLIAQSSLFGLFANNLNELTLNFDPNYNHVGINVDNVIKLMKSFGAFTNLHTFSLHISCVLIESIFANNHQTIQLFYRMIGDCITREKFPKLTNFDLNIDCSSIAQNHEFNQLNHEIDFDPHLLSQLEHFSLDFYTKRVPVLMGQLNPNLTFLSFNCDLLPAHYSLPKVEQLDPALLGEPQFGPSLTHLRLSGAWDLQLKLFCDRFSALQSVQLSACYRHHYFDGNGSNYSTN